jgi:hypothetical protein
VIEKFTGGKLERTNGASNGITLIGHKLFIYPATEKDHDIIFTHKLWPLAKNQSYSLGNKGKTIILRGISCVEIDDHPDIYKDLSHLGIQNWRPLAANDRNYGGCKAECETRGNLVDIMHKWYVSGKSYPLKNGLTAQVRFDPNVKNPINVTNVLAFHRIPLRRIMQINAPKRPSMEIAEVKHTWTTMKIVATKASV